MTPQFRTPLRPIPANAPLKVNIQPKSILDQTKVRQRIKQKRSQEYIEALLRLDAGNHLHDPKAVEDVIAAISQEFADLEPKDRPLGYVQKCILAPHLEVHAISFSGQEVLKHYAFNEAMPPLFEQARMLAIHPNHRSLNTYVFVEIYLNHIVPVYAGGTVTCIDSVATSWIPTQGR